MSSSMSIHGQDEILGGFRDIALRLLNENPHLIDVMVNILRGMADKLSKYGTQRGNEIHTNTLSIEDITDRATRRGNLVTPGEFKYRLIMNVMGKIGYIPTSDNSLDDIIVDICAQKRTEEILSTIDRLQIPSKTGLTSRRI